MSDRAIAFLKNALLVFVLVSVGFALGKEVTVRRQAAASDTGSPAISETGDKVVVYYLHTTFRCVTCNEIERLAKALVETEFGEELRAGRIEWREANFQQDEVLAKRYEVVSSCVVVANIQSGKETGFQRLDDVWTRYQNPADFNEYVGAAIRKSLGETGGME
jgi:hypothetical protein